MLVLASASPRRREALEAMGIAVEVVPSEVVESRLPGESPEAFASRMAVEKASDVAARLGGRAAVVLGADTVVALGDEVLGKPRDRADARRMIATLAGRVHRVATAWALVSDGRVAKTGIGIAEVEFRPLSEVEIDAYVESGDGDDKAGAYAVQGRGIWLVRRVTGSLTAVVGLPAPEVGDALREIGAA